MTKTETLQTLDTLHKKLAQAQKSQAQAINELKMALFQYEKFCQDVIKELREK